MRTAVVDRFGEPDVLGLVERPIPKPGQRQALIRVHAGGLNYSDLLQREGVYPGGPKPPYVPGIEAAGIVEEVHEDSTKIPPGSRVACFTKAGAHAEYVVADCENCVLLPDTVSLPEGAALLIQYLTAYHALAAAHPRAGETILIHAASGGVGTAAVQIAKLLGLRVIGTASTQEKRDFALTLGADGASGYEDFETATREVTHGHGPDIILDTVGGDVSQRNLKLLPAFGRLVVAGLAARAARPVDTVRLLFHSQSVIGFHLSAVFERRDLLANSLEQILRWLKEGRIRIQVGHSFALADIRASHELLASRKSRGKIVLIP